MPCRQLLRWWHCRSRRVRHRWKLLSGADGRRGRQPVRHRQVWDVCGSVAVPEFLLRRPLHVRAGLILRGWQHYCRRRALRNRQLLRGRRDGRCPMQRGRVRSAGWFVVVVMYSRSNVVLRQTQVLVSCRISKPDLVCMRARQLRHQQRKCELLLCCLRRHMLCICRVLLRRRVVLVHGRPVQRRVHLCRWRRATGGVLDSRAVLPSRLNNFARCVAVIVNGALIRVCSRNCPENNRHTDSPCL